MLDSEANTPLIWGARMGSLEAVDVLLNRSADVSVRNKNGITALFLAASYGHDEVVGQHFIVLLTKETPGSSFNCSSITQMSMQRMIALGRHFTELLVANTWMS